jgi:hypothetical protein
VSFQSIRTHLLLAHPLEKEAGADSRAVVEALRKGSSFVSNYRQGDARGFRFWAESDNAAFLPGSQALWQPSLVLRAIVPSRARMKLLKNGLVIREQPGAKMECSVDGPGVYRMEAKKGEKDWIFSNPIYFRGAVA